MALIMQWSAEIYGCDDLSSVFAVVVVVVVIFGRVAQSLFAS